MDSDRVTGTLTDVGGKIQKGVGDLTGDTKLQADGTLDQLKGTAQNLAGQAKDAVRDAAGQASELAGQAYARGQDAYAKGRDALPDTARDAYRDGSRALSEQLQGSPLGALLIAGAIGYAAAWLIHGRD